MYTSSTYCLRTAPKPRATVTVHSDFVKRAEMDRLSRVGEHVAAEHVSAFSWEGLERDSIEGVSSPAPLTKPH